MPKHFYVFVRTDLPIAQQLVQAVHAAYESGIRYGDESTIDSVVLCEADNELHLKQIAHRLKCLSIPITEFNEPDIGYQLTAISTSPLTKDKRKLLSKYRLWRSK